MVAVYRRKNKEGIPIFVSAKLGRSQVKGETLQNRLRRRTPVSDLARGGRSDCPEWCRRFIVPESEASRRSTSQCKAQPFPIQGNDESIQDIAAYQDAVAIRRQTTNCGKFVALDSKSNVVNNTLRITAIVTARPHGRPRGESQRSDPSLRDDGNVRAAVQLAAQRTTGEIGDWVAQGDVSHSRWWSEASVVSRHGSTRQFGRWDFENQRRLPDVRDIERRIANARKHP